MYIVKRLCNWFHVDFLNSSVHYVNFLLTTFKIKICGQSLKVRINGMFNRFLSLIMEKYF
jgi:hypothetical protein